MRVSVRLPHFAISIAIGLTAAGLILAAGLAHSDERVDACSNPPGVPTKPNPACKVTKPVPAKVGKQRSTPAAPGKPEQAMLPGLGLLPGEKRPMMANVVRVASHYNEVLYVSSGFPNRISTPFAAPKLIDNSEVEWQVQGQSLYLSPKSPEKPVGIFVTGSGVNDPVVSLTLIPRNLPAQTIILQLDEDRSSTAGAEQSGESEDVPGGISGKASSYMDRLRGILRHIVMGKTPAGFSEGLLPMAVGRRDALLVMPEKRYSGQHLDVFMYRVENVGPEEIELAEPSFYRDGVRAVSIYPVIKLRKGMSTSVYVLSDKGALVASSAEPAQAANDAGRTSGGGQ
jgi:conjugal transfer pilus assembly protein TraK